MIVMVATARFALLSLVPVLTAGAGLVGGPSIGQAEAGVDLSRDRATWVAELDDPLFLPGLPWKPGDVRRSTFFVRNDTGGTVDVRVALSRASAPTDPLLTVSAGTAGDTIESLAADGEAHVLRVHDLDAGDIATVTLRASLSKDAPDDTQVDGTVIDYRVTPEDDGGFASSARLELAPLFLGLALIGAAGIVSRRKNRLRNP